jgi:hypothetical protein
MRNKFTKLLVLGIVSFSVVMVCCKKDDTKIENGFTYELNDFTFKSGHQTAYGQTTHSPNATYMFKVILASSGIAFDNASNSFTGKGDFIHLTMYSMDSESLSPGLYTFDRFTSKDSLTISDISSVCINYDIVSKTDTTIYDISSGVVDVVRYGSVYTLDFDLYTDEEIQVKGFYKGSLELHAATVKK